MTRKILFLCHRLPYPPNKGDKIRSYALLRYLASRGNVSLACYVDEREDLEYLDTVRAMALGGSYFELLGPLMKRWRSMLALLTGRAITVSCFRSASLQRWVDHQVNDTAFDDVVVFGSAMAPYLLKARIPKNRVMFDMVDVDSDKWSQYAAASRGLMRWIYRREARMLERLECEAAAAFGKTLLVSPFEATTFRQIAYASAPKIGVLTNGVALRAYSADATTNPFGSGHPVIVMTGRMDYRPNYEGAEWFISEVMPLILRTLPEAKVYFVGACPPAKLTAMANPHIVVTGSVADIRPYIQFADVVIAPLRIARGVQNKVLEAMAMAKPVVVTREASRSLDVEHGEQLWIANDPNGFAKAVFEALGGPARAVVASNGRRYVEQHHNWEHLLAEFGRDLDALQSGLIEESRPHRNVNGIREAEAAATQ